MFLENISDTTSKPAEDPNGIASSSPANQTQTSDAMQACTSQREEQQKSLK